MKAFDKYCIVQPDMFDKRDKVKMAVDRMKEFEPGEGYYLAFSGGKDSVVLYDLAIKSGVKFDAHYAVTTVDPPELMRFIKEHYPAVIWDRPIHSMWALIGGRLMPPTRLMRYCCGQLKECHGSGRTVLTGIRWEESQRRNSRGMYETCYKNKTKHYLNAIIDFTVYDVWNYIKNNNIPYCELYDQGFKRLGCIGCPMSSERTKEFVRWPKYKTNYIKAFDKMLEYRKSRESETQWKTGQEVFDWWVSQ